MYIIRYHKYIYHASFLVLCIYRTNILYTFIFISFEYFFFFLIFVPRQLYKEAKYVFSNFSADFIVQSDIQPISRADIEFQNNLELSKYLSFPLSFESSMLVVNDAESVANAKKILDETIFSVDSWKKQSDKKGEVEGEEGSQYCSVGNDRRIHWVGVDCEWRAVLERYKKSETNFGRYDNSGASILQMATHDRCFIFDFSSIMENSRISANRYDNRNDNNQSRGRNQTTAFPSPATVQSPAQIAAELLKQIFSDERIIKCGWCFDEDLKMLRNSGKGYFRESFLKSKSIVDLSEVTRILQKSDTKSKFVVVVMMYIDPSLSFVYIHKLFLLISPSSSLLSIPISHRPTYFFSIHLVYLLPLLLTTNLPSFLSPLSPPQLNILNRLPRRGLQTIPGSRVKQI